MAALRRRGVLLGVAGVFALGACRALLDLEDGPPAPDGLPDGSVAEAAAALDGGADAPADGDLVPCPRFIPPEGVYTYATTSPLGGREQIWVLDANGMETEGIVLLDEVVGPRFTATVRHDDASRWRYRVDFHPLHYNEYTFIASPQAGLSVPKLEENLANNAVIANCDPPVDAIRCPMIVGAQWAGAATGTFFDAGFDAKLAFTFRTTESLAVAGRLVESYHVIETREVSRELSGREHNEYWFSIENGLLLQAKVQVGTIGSGVVDGIVFRAFGVNQYKVNVEFRLVSTVPAPLPSDAGADADTDADTDAGDDG